MTPPTRTAPDVREAARLRLMAARIVAIKRTPYLSTMLFSLRLVDTPADRLATMAVDDRWRMYYNASFVLMLDTDELATVVIHEAMHCLMSHSRRFRDTLATGGATASEPAVRHKAWNIAGDCAINAILSDEGMPFPAESPGVRFEDFHASGMTPDQTTEANHLKLLDMMQQTVDHTDCGSASGGQPRDYEIAGDDSEAPEADGAEQDRVRDRVALDIKEHATRGNVPSELARWADVHLEPRIDWRKQLAVRVRAAVANVAGRRDYTFQRPSRRQSALTAMGSDIVIPAMRQPAPPRVAVVADTSGSIGVEELNAYIGELSGIIRAVGLGHGLTVIPCDAQAYEPVVLRNRAGLLDLEFTGGGGTDMGVGIAAALDVRPSPHVVVVLTDGCTPWPAANPDPNTHFICMLTDERAADQVPMWMSTVLLPSE